MGIKKENKKIDNNSAKNDKPWWLPPINMFIRISGWIIFPLIAALFLGKYIDNKYNDGHSKFLLIFAGLAFLITIIGLIKSTKKELKKIEQNEKKEDKK